MSALNVWILLDEELQDVISYQSHSPKGNKSIASPKIYKNHRSKKELYTLTQHIHNRLIKRRVKCYFLPPLQIKQSKISSNYIKSKHVYAYQFSI